MVRFGDISQKRLLIIVEMKSDFCFGYRNKIRITRASGGLERVIIETGVENFSSQSRFESLKLKTQNVSNEFTYIRYPKGIAVLRSVKIKSHTATMFKRSRWSFSAEMSFHIYQYLQSKNYALPYLHYSVADLIELGIYM